MSNSNNPDKGTRNLVIGMVAFIVLVGAVFSFISNKSSSTAKVPAAVSATDGYGIVLNANATPKIDVYVDYQCPICKNFEIINGGYLAEIAASGKAKIVYHPMTFIGAESILAANAAACAADEGKFLDMNIALFQNQSGTENSGLWTGDYMKRLGNSIGLKSAAFEKCVTDGTYVDWTKNVADASAKANVNGTPTVKVNGKELHRKMTNSDPVDEYMDPVQFKNALIKAGVK